MNKEQIEDMRMCLTRAMQVLEARLQTKYEPQALFIMFVGPDEKSSEAEIISCGQTEILDQIKEQLQLTVDFEYPFGEVQ